MKFPWCVGPRKALSWPCVEQTLVDLDLNRRRPFLSPPATHRNWILCSLLNVERRCSWEVWAEVLRCCGNRRQWQTCSTFPCISGELHLPLSELCLFLQAPSLSNKVSSWLFTKYLIDLNLSSCLPCCEIIGKLHSLWVLPCNMGVILATFLQSWNEG